MKISQAGRRPVIDSNTGLDLVLLGHALLAQHLEGEGAPPVQDEFDPPKAPLAQRLLDPELVVRRRRRTRGWRRTAVLESTTGRRPAWDIFKPLYLAQIELVFHVLNR